MYTNVNKNFRHFLTYDCYPVFAPIAPKFRCRETISEIVDITNFPFL